MADTLITPDPLSPGFGDDLRTYRESVKGLPGGLPQEPLTDSVDRLVRMATAPPPGVGLDQHKKFPGRGCCALPVVEYVGRAGAGHHKDCDNPVWLFCVRCSTWAVMRCKATRVSKCRRCAGWQKSRRRRRIHRRMDQLAPGHSYAVTVTPPGDRQHCRHHKDCDGVAGPQCEVCPCTPPEGVDRERFNADAKRQLGRLLQAVARGEAFPDLVHSTRAKRRRPTELAYVSAAEVFRDGLLHFHLIVMRADGKRMTIDKAKFRLLLIRYGFGHRNTCERIGELGRKLSRKRTKGGQRKTAAQWIGYMVKYATKSSDDLARCAWPTDELNRRGEPRLRTITFSRNWDRALAAVEASADEKTGRDDRDAECGGAASAPGVALVSLRPDSTGISTKQILQWLIRTDEVVSEPPKPPPQLTLPI